MINKLSPITKKQIAERIRAIRQDGNCGVIQLADSTGLTPSYISQLERGTSTPSLATIFRICKALHISVSDFFKELK